MKRIVLFMHISLDGFVAGPKGEMDWIHVDEDLFDYAGRTTDQADVALYGRKTYQMMESYWPTAGNQPGATRHDVQHATWYNTVPKVILSQSMKGAIVPNAKIISENISAEIANLKKGTGKDIVIFGSPGAVHSLMEFNLIDDFWLFVNPVLLGSGIPLFRGIAAPRKLQLQLAKTISSGVVCLHYKLKSDQ